MGLWRTLLQIIAISYEAEKPKEMDFPLEPPEGSSPIDIVALVQ
jgi:hypothetical protein